MQLISNKPLFTRQELIEICLQINPSAYLSMTDEEKAKLYDLVYDKTKKFQSTFDDLKCPPRYFSILLQRYLVVRINKELGEYNKLLQATYAQVIAQLEPVELEENTLEDFLDKRIIK